MTSGLMSKNRASLNCFGVTNFVSDSDKICHKQGSVMDSSKAIFKFQAFSTDGGLIGG